MNSFILPVGTHSDDGRLESSNWRWAGAVVARLADSIRIYTRESESEIRGLFGTANVQPESGPDPTMDVNAYLVSGESEHIAEVVFSMCTDPMDGISHIYAMRGDECIFSFEAADGENFVLFSRLVLSELKDPGQERATVVPRTALFEQYSSELAELAEGNPWEGVALKSD